MAYLGRLVQELQRINNNLKIYFYGFFKKLRVKRFQIEVPFSKAKTINRYSTDKTHEQGILEIDLAKISPVDFLILKTFQCPLKIEDVQQVFFSERQPKSLLLPKGLQHVFQEKYKQYSRKPSYRRITAGDIFRKVDFIMEGLQKISLIQIYCRRSIEHQEVFSLQKTTRSFFHRRSTWDLLYRRSATCLLRYKILRSSFFDRRREGVFPRLEA